MRYPIVLLLVSLVGWAKSSPALAHGAHIDHQTVSGIEIQARYDSGEPMKQAQVTVYAPANPAEPWLSGTTDAEGRFFFTPDPNQPGNWEVKVRQAGHGDIVTIPVTAGAAATASPGQSPTAGPGAGGEIAASTPITPEAGSLTPTQRWITIGAVIWGFLGTALFFSRGKR